MCVQCMFKIPCHHGHILYRFDPPTQFGDTISPVCLPNDDEVPNTNTECFSTG